MQAFRKIALALPILAAAFGAAAHSVYAADVSFSPSRLTLSARARNASVTLTNRGGAPVRFEIHGFRWDQESNGQMKLVASDELVVFPSLLTIAPGQARVVRVADAAPPSSVERSFRLQISEIPEFPGPSAKGTTSITLKSQFDLPLFYLPLEERVVGAITDASVSRSKLSFSVTNTGTVHFKPDDVRVVGLGVGGKQVYAKSLDAWYVLAGGRREFSLELPPATCASLAAVKITVGTEIPIKEMIEVPPNACHA
jgi:fimbrial chaperone protein